MPSKKKTNVEDVATTVTEPESKGEEHTVQPEAGASPPPPSGPRKSLGTKEIIPFKWKVVGKSGDFVVTLFKSTERPEADAQLERAHREGYYTDLQIVDVDMQFKQPRIQELRDLTKPKEEKKTRQPASTNKRDGGSTKSTKSADEKKAKTTSKDTKAPGKKSAKSSDNSTVAAGSNKSTKTKVKSITTKSSKKSSSSAKKSATPSAKKTATTHARKSTKKAARSGKKKTTK